jgi:hypothetical protein
MVCDNADIITPRESHRQGGLLSPPKVVVTDHKDTNVPDTAHLVQVHDESTARANVSKKPSKLKLKLKGRSATTTAACSISNNNNSDGEEIIILDQEEEKTIEKSKDHSKKSNSEPSSNATPTRSKERSKRNSPNENSNNSNGQDDAMTIASTTPNNHNTSSGVKRKKRKVGNQSMVLEPSTVPQPSEESNESVVPFTSKSQNKNNNSSTKKDVPKKKNTFQDQVLLHMLTCMKPFTLKSLAAELRTTDIALHHLMLSLVDKGIVRRKEFGNKVKKELYWVDIESATKHVYGNTLPSLLEMENAKAELLQILNEESNYLETMKRMEMELSNEDLSTKLQQEETSLANLKERVQQAKDRILEKTSQSSKSSSLQGKLGRPLSFKDKPKTRKQLKKEINRMRNEWKARKEKCTDFIDNLADAMEKRPKDVIKLLDIETDEMLGVKIPPKQDLES